MRHALCQVLKHGDEPSDCESSCPCYYSQIQGLGLKVYITRYAIRIQANDKNYKSKEFANRYLLSLVLNTVTDDDSLMSNGKLFHNFEAATEYALSS